LQGSARTFGLLFPNTLADATSHPLFNFFEAGNTYEIRGKGDTWIGSQGETSSRSSIETEAAFRVHSVVSLTSNATDAAILEIGGTGKTVQVTSSSTAFPCTLVIFDNKFFGTSLEAITNIGGSDFSKAFSTELTSISLEGIDQTNHQQASTSHMTKNINVYSFALKPEEHQPSGTCNFSRIDTAQLITDTTIGDSHNIYAVNYNVLRIMSGMGGLAYSN
jgi:hypothetical protein